MIDIKRVALYGLLALVLYTLWTDWNKDYPATATNSSSNAVTLSVPSTSHSGEVQITPSSNQTMEHGVDVNQQSMNSADAIASQANLKMEQPLTYVETDVLKAGFNVDTGDLVDLRFLKYTESDSNPTPFVMLSNEASKQYITLTRLLSIQKDQLENTKVQFDKKSIHVTEDKAKGEWLVSMTGKTANNLVIKKEFVFNKGQYLINVNYVVSNEGKEAWEGSWTTQLLQHEPSEDKSSLFHLGSYSGGAVSIPGDKLYKKISYEDMQKESFDKTIKGGWVAMQQHYFLSAWIPAEDSTHKFYTQVAGTDYIVGMLSNPVHIDSNQTFSFNSRLYVGPEDMSVLKKIAPGLDLTIDYGWLSFISVFLFFILENVYRFVGNWGWSIILVTLIIKLAFYHLSAKSYTSMANMRKLQPKIDALRLRFADDKTKLSQATMELYKKEKVNPLGGCLPIVVQIPVFIGLYWVLLESVQLRQAPFIFWIHDLAIPDPYYILPIIMGITMFVQQKLNPPPPDPMQAKIMLFLPVVFTGMFLHFPAGLVLYWIMNNTLSIIQQWYITSKINNTIIEKRFTPKKIMNKKSEK